MAYKLINEAYCPYANEKRREFICDTDADVENLPKCCTGSKALSVATGITHMVNASGNWVPLGGGIVGGSLADVSEASVGLAFTLKGDGTYEVSGLGECTDTDVVFPAEVDGIAVTSIGVYAFGMCKGLTSINIPNTVTRIEVCAFDACTGLTSVEIPASVTYIGEDAFAGCSSLTSITFEGTIEQWNAIEFYHIDGWHRNVPATYVQCSDGQVAL